MNTPSPFMDQLPASVSKLPCGASTGVPTNAAGEHPVGGACRTMSASGAGGCPSSWQSPLANYFDPWQPNVAEAAGPLAGDCGFFANQWPRQSLQAKLVGFEREDCRSSSPPPSTSYDTDADDIPEAADCASPSETSGDTGVEDDEVVGHLPAGEPTSGRSSLPTRRGWKVPEQYELGRLLGSGSYGTVCDAWDTAAERAVAVKKVTDVFRCEAHCRRILREVVLLSRLNHSHVVQLVDLPRPENWRRFDDVYIVTEVCDTDLLKVCSHPQGVSLAQARRLAYGLLVGCKYLHSAGVYHRDLKPSNCLVNRDCSLRICDFNLARAVAQEVDSTPTSGTRRSSSGQPSRITRSLTQLVASCWYRPPEVLLRVGYSEAMDMWSAGCIVAELFMALRTSDHLPDWSPLFPGEERGPAFSGGGLDQSAQDGESGDSGSSAPADTCDMLSMIFDVLGTPSDAELAQMPGEARRKIRLYEKRAGCGLAPFVPAGAGVEAVSLLAAMLRFVPSKRVSAAQALQHPFFDRVLRSPDEDKVAPGPISLEFDAPPPPCVGDEDEDGDEDTEEEEEEEGFWTLELRHEFQKEIGKFQMARAQGEPNTL